MPIARNFVGLAATASKAGWFDPWIPVTLVQERPSADHHVAPWRRPSPAGLPVTTKPARFQATASAVRPALFGRRATDQVAPSAEKKAYAALPPNPTTTTPGSPAATPWRTRPASDVDPLADFHDRPSVEVQMTPGGVSPVETFPTAYRAPWKLARSTRLAAPRSGWTGRSCQPASGVGDGVGVGVEAAAVDATGEALGAWVGAAVATGDGLAVEAQAARRTVVATRAMRAANSLMFRALNAVVTIGRDAEGPLLNYSGMTRNKIRFIPNWATLVPAARPLSQDNPFRKALSARFIVGLSGNLGFTHDP